MGISLSGGPWQYNRFNLAEASKPDYLDFDKDGNKKEPMKKALKEKSKKKDDCECDKKEVKEWVSGLIDQGYDLSEYTWDDMIEMFSEGLKHREVDTGKVVDKAEIGKTYYPHGERQKSSVKKQKVDPFGGRFKKEEVEDIEERWVGKHGQFDTEYARSRSPGGKMISGDDKRSGAEYTHGRRVKVDNPGMQPDVGGKTKPKSQGRMDKATREDLKYRKANLKAKKGMKEEVCDYLMNEGFANNPVSAEIMFNHMSEEWLDAIKEIKN